ncbi:MAG: hypothetical protein II670_07825 [Alphaproteobacteria bacterium]|nr:hypothetical protein [Alphaproteobacteria bacterium]
MKLFKTVMAGILCMMVSQAMAYTEFMEHIDECHWLNNDQKEILKQLPPLNEYADKLIEEEKKKIQDKKVINLEQAKLQAINFYKNYLSCLPSEYLNIAENIINSGEYQYLQDCFAGFKGSAMNVIPYDIEIPDKLEEGDNISDYLTHRIDELLSCISLGEIRDNMLAPIRKQYLDKDKITENFRIEVMYNNGAELPIQIIHETAHVLDYAYRIKNHIYTENVKGRNHESVSIFLELLARKEYGMSLFDNIRLVELYREMLQHDYLRRIIDDLKKIKDKKIEKKKAKEIVVNLNKIDKIKNDIDKDWSSKLDWQIKYVDFDENCNETQKTLKRIKSGEQGIDVLCEYIHNIGRAFDIISTNNITATDMPGILENLVTKTTQPISAKTFQKWLKG